MFHSIISDYDVFFAGADFDPAFYEVEDKSGTSANKKGECRQSGFFSTDPKDYLNLCKLW